MEKRGQFFLIAALIISGIAIGFSTLYNSAYIERADTQVYDLSEELHAELQQTYDAGMVRGESQDEIDTNLKKLAEYYQMQNPDSTFVIFYGNNEDGVNRLDTSGENDGSELTVIEEGTTNTGDSTGTRGTQSEGNNPSTGEHTTKKKLKVRVRLRDVSTSTTQSSPTSSKSQTRERVLESPPFELKPGQNFYFVIRKKVKNEQVVVYRK